MSLAVDQPNSYFKHEPHIVDKISILDVDHFDFMNVISNAYIEDLPSHKTEKIRKGRYTGCIRFYPSMRIMMSPLRRKAGD